MAQGHSSAGASAWPDGSMRLRASGCRNRLGDPGGGGREARAGGFEGRRARIFEGIVAPGFACGDGRGGSYRTPPCRVASSIRAAPRPRWPRARGSHREAREDLPIARWSPGFSCGERREDPIGRSRVVSPRCSRGEARGSSTAHRPLESNLRFSSGRRRDPIGNERAGGAEARPAAS